MKPAMRFVQDGYVVGERFVAPVVGCERTQAGRLRSQNAAVQGGAATLAQYALCQTTVRTPVPTMLFSKLLPREGNFFELFNRHADCVYEAAQAFQLLVRDYGDETLRNQHDEAVSSAERAADRVTREVNRLIHTTFITPIDREQIHGLINHMDDVVDLLQDITETMELYDVRELGEEVRRLTEWCVRSCAHMRDAVHLLGKLSDEETAKAILRACEDIDQIESNADREMRAAMSQLFRQEGVDARDLIKRKAIYEMLETVTDKCEDVANRIEGIVLESS